MDSGGLVVVSVTYTGDAHVVGGVCVALFSFDIVPPYILWEFAGSVTKSLRPVEALGRKLLSRNELLDHEYESVLAGVSGGSCR